MIDRAQILNRLIRFNDHWESGAPIVSKYKFKRKLFAQLKKDNQFIITIKGLRRTGKSVLQRQLMEEFCKIKEVTGKRVLFFSFDNPDQLNLMPPQTLELVLDLYFKDILKERVGTAEKPVLIALDEVQNVEGWQAVTKTFYDLNPNIKFIITGSSSLYLKDGDESLVGRSIDYNLPCLDFEEFLDMLEYQNKLPFASSINSLLDIPITQINYELLDLFHVFFLIGGFPDAVRMYKNGVEIHKIQQFIKNTIILKIINLDLKKYFRLEKSFSDNTLFNIVANESGSFFELKNLSSEVGLSQESLKKHLNIFEKTSLIQRLTKYDKKLRREVRSSKKYYASSPCLMYSFLSKDNTKDTAFLGHVAETYAFNKLSQYSSKIYVDNYRNTHEIDFILHKEKLLLESKYSDNARRKDFDYLNTRAKELNYQAIIISKADWYVCNQRGIPLMLI